MSLGQNGGSGSDTMPAHDSPVPQPATLGAVSPEPTAPAATDPAADPESSSNAEPSPPRKKPEPKLCGVCGTEPGKYKCPRCSMPYCSVACNKLHKENHPPDAPKPSPPPTTATAPAPEEAQKEEADDPYSILLDHRAAFQHLFQRYPSLPAELTRIQATTLPPSSSSSSSSAPSFLGHNPTANTGRNRQPQPWTRDLGLRRGAAALRKARTDPGDTGDGVREFCELVRFLLGQRRDGVEKVREEVAAEETRVIERLMREERG